MFQAKEHGMDPVHVHWFVWFVVGALGVFGAVLGLTAWFSRSQ
jgi:hypothetical protein